MRALMRVELRQFARYRSRSLLIVLLIAIPVAGMVGGSTLMRVTQVTADERQANALGQAQILIEANSVESEERIRTLLPEDARIERILRGRGELRVPGRRVQAMAIALRAQALSETGVAHGLIKITEGHAPTNSNQVALTPGLVKVLELELGMHVTIDGSSTPAVLTGILVDPEDLDAPLMLVDSDTSPLSSRCSFLVTFPEEMKSAVASDLREASVRFRTREDYESSDPFEALVLFVIGGFALFEAALIIAAAFAVSLRRRQHEIGLLGATGASVRAMNLALLLSASTLAAIGSLLGVLVGIGSARALHPYLDLWNRRLNGEFELSYTMIAGAVALGILTATLAAVLPARSASRLPIRVALSGARPITTPSGKWLKAGLLILAAGSALLGFGAFSGGQAAGVIILVGAVVTALGISACSPWFLDRFAKLATPLPLSWRLAVRDAGRFRSRNGPVVCAVLAGMSISIMAASIISSVEALIGDMPASLRDDQVLIEGADAREVATRFAGETEALAMAALNSISFEGAPLTVQVERGSNENGPVHWIACGDEQLLFAMGAESSIEAFRAGHLIAFDPKLAKLSMHFVAANQTPDLEFPPVEFVTRSQNVMSPLFLLNSATLTNSNRHTAPPPRSTFSPYLVRLKTPVSQVHLDQAIRIASESIDTSVQADLMRAKPAGNFLRIILLLCFTTGLIVIFIATSLSSVESAADARTLHTVGASPRLLRDHLAVRASYLALLGGALAVPAGLLPAAAMMVLSSERLDFTVPTPEILITVIGLPLIAYVGTWLFALRNKLSPNLAT